MNGFSQAQALAIEKCIATPDSALVHDVIEIPLLSGDFTPEGAREPLLNLIINYTQQLERQLFSIYEKSSEKDQALLDEVKRLDKLRQDVLTLIEKAKQNTKQVSVSSCIRIRLD